MGHTLSMGCEENEALWHTDRLEFVLGEWYLRTSGKVPARLFL